MKTAFLLLVFQFIFYIKKEQDSLFFGHFLKVVDNKTQQSYLVGIILRKLKEGFWRLTQEIIWDTIAKKNICSCMAPGR